MILSLSVNQASLKIRTESLDWLEQVILIALTQVTPLYLRNRDLQGRRDPRRAWRRTRGQLQVRGREIDSGYQSPTCPIVQPEDNAAFPVLGLTWADSAVPNFDRSWGTAPILRSACRSLLSFDLLERQARWLIRANRVREIIFNCFHAHGSLQPRKPCCNSFLSLLCRV